MYVNFLGKDVKVAFETYAENGNTAILLTTEDEEYGTNLFAVASVNSNRKFSRNLVSIKDWSENTGMVEALVEGNVIKPEIVAVQPSGLVDIKTFELTEEALAEFERQVGE